MINKSELIAILKEASEIIEVIDPNHAPNNIRWPIADELYGFALLLENDTQEAA
jgi:hypothetical protein